MIPPLGVCSGLSARKSTITPGIGVNPQSVAQHRRTPLQPERSPPRRARRPRRGGRALESRATIDQKGPVRFNRLSSKEGGRMGRAATALVGFAGWFALLSILLGLYRIRYVLGGRKAANTFTTDGQDLDD